MEEKMKKWRKDGEPESFTSIADHIKKAIKFAYKMERTNVKKDIKWEGLDIGQKEKATCYSPDEQLTAENLKYSFEEQDKDALDEILALALRLGIEQGRRIEKSGLEKNLLTMRIDIISVELKEIKRMLSKKA